MIQSGAIGHVREAHVWTSRPVWEFHGHSEALPGKPVPETLDWDRWLGPAHERAYNPGYAPFNWRAWQEFGAGALGDMACHLMDPVYMSLDLVHAANYTVEAIDIRGRNEQTFPTWTTIKYSFPERGALAPVDVYWYDGHYPDPSGDGNVYNRPAWPKGVPKSEELGDKNRNGSFLVGDTGIITAGEYGGKPRLLPASAMESYTLPPETLQRVPDEDHYQNWLQAIKGNGVACSHFSYAGPFTEMVSFGNLVVKSGRKLHWDNLHGVVTNVPNGASLVSKEYRKGWELPC
jgi:predicted dehydrogenase